MFPKIFLTFANENTNENTNNNLMTMKKMKLREFWEAQSVECRNKILIEMADKCRNSIQTVRAWMLEYRNPKGLDREALFTYIKDNFQVEIIEAHG